MKKILANALLIIASVLAGLLLVVAADRLVGWLHRGEKENLALLFPPNSDVYYKTIEFEYAVHTNNLGFRGEDTGLAKTRKTRVIALGDSYTYGWGVKLDDTWIKRVETKLRAAGHDVEIFNLGVPGAGPIQYADRAEEVIPLLKPDIVLVGLLQGDDLSQSDSKPNAKGGSADDPDSAQTAARSSRLHSILDCLFPHLLQSAARQRRALAARMETQSAARWDSISNTWKRQAHRLLGNLTEEDMRMFHTFPLEVQRGFENGELNPTNLTMLFPPGSRGAKRPVDQPSESAAPAPVAQNPKFAHDLDLNSDLTQRRIKVCAQQLERIRTAARKAGARVVAVSIPDSGFVVLSGWKRMLENGASPAIRREWAESLVTTVPDQAYRQACERAGIPLMEVTAAYREKAKGIECFYPYDTHFTPEGNRLFAEILTPLLDPYLK